MKFSMFNFQCSIALLLLALTAPSATAQPVPPTTAFTRYLMTSTNQAQFQSRAGIDTNGVGTTYNLSASTNLPYTGLDDAARASVTNAATQAARDATNNAALTRDPEVETAIRYIVQTNNPTRFYFRGDSIFTFYNIAQYSNTWPAIFTNLAPGPFQTPIFYNASIAGSYATSYPSLYMSEAGASANRAPTNSRSFYFVGGGVNDLYVSTTNEVIFDAISNACVLARADRHRVIASTVTPNFTSLADVGYSNNWFALNEKIIAASNLWDGLIRADLYITNTSQTVDALHPGRAANVILANVALRVALGVLTPDAQIGDAAYSTITAKTNVMRFMWLDVQGFQAGQNATKSTGFNAGTGYYNGEPYYVDWIKLDSNVSSAAVYRGLPFGVGFSNFVITWYLAWPVAADCRMTNTFASYTHGATRSTSTGNFINTFTNGLNLLRMTNSFANDSQPRSITYNMPQNTNGGSLYLLGAEIEWR